MRLSIDISAFNRNQKYRRITLLCDNQRFYSKRHSPFHFFSALRQARLLDFSQYAGLEYQEGIRKILQYARCLPYGIDPLLAVAVKSDRRKGRF